MSDTSKCPHWVLPYIGIPYDEGGRHKDVGLDCWGLLRTVYWEQYKVDLPEFKGFKWNVNDTRTQLSALEAFIVQERNELIERGTFHEVPAECAQEGDAIVVRTLGWPLHIGIYLYKGYMLTSREGCNACIESYLHPAIAPRVDGFYRHESLI